MYSNYVFILVQQTNIHTYIHTIDQLHFDYTYWQINWYGVSYDDDDDDVYLE
jgi:hypothetical protein